MPCELMIVVRIEDEGRLQARVATGGESWTQDRVFRALAKIEAIAAELMRDAGGTMGLSPVQVAQHMVEARAVALEEPPMEGQIQWRQVMPA